MWQDKVVNKVENKFIKSFLLRGFDIVYIFSSVYTELLHLWILQFWSNIRQCLLYHKTPGIQLVKCEIYYVLNCKVCFINSHKYVCIQNVCSLFQKCLQVFSIMSTRLLQLISYKRFLECTLIKWRLSIYPLCTQVPDGTFFMKSQYFNVYKSVPIMFTSLFSKCLQVC